MSVDDLMLDADQCGIMRRIPNFSRVVLARRRIDKQVSPRGARAHAGPLSPAAALLAAASPALADWQKDLAAQLRWDHECAVRFYSGVIERLIEAQMVMIAKAQCEDGRTFDAIQRDAPEDFEITECTPTEQACSGECVSRKH